MGNCCGESKNTFWVPIPELRDKTLWRKGWVTLEDIRIADGGELFDVTQCFLCKGDKIRKCVECDAQGQIENYRPLYD